MRKIFLISMAISLLISCSEPADSIDVSEVYGEYELTDGTLIINSSECFIQLYVDEDEDGNLDTYEASYTYSSSTGIADVIVTDTVESVTTPSYSCSYGNIGSSDSTGSGTLTPDSGSTKARHITVTAGSSSVTDCYKTVYTGITFTTASTDYTVYIRDPASTDSDDQEKDYRLPYSLNGTSVMLYFKKPVSSSSGSSDNTQTFYIKNSSGSNYGGSGTVNDMCIWPQNTPVYAFKTEVTE
ncbi:hypothetical protein [Treponema sp.]|uniref:hypothetical protein n=1 Tax=Treponema sp. TaxID=166 RepID=UPI0025E01EDB|nr:hypothetical protein [Treponema sp.]MCR5217730.1 hypothetical protein [Treponema sp.]